MRSDVDREEGRRASIGLNSVTPVTYTNTSTYKHNHVETCTSSHCSCRVIKHVHTQTQTHSHVDEPKPIISAPTYACQFVILLMVPSLFKIIGPSASSFKESPPTVNCPSASCPDICSSCNTSDDDAVAVDAGADAVDAMVTTIFKHNVTIKMQVLAEHTDRIQLCTVTLTHQD